MFTLRNTFYLWGLSLLFTVYAQDVSKWVVKQYTINQLQVTDKQLEKIVTQNTQYIQKCELGKNIYGELQFTGKKSKVLVRVSFGSRYNALFIDYFGKPAGYFFINGVKIHIIMKDVPNENEILKKHFTILKETETVKWNVSSIEYLYFEDWTFWDYYYRNGKFILNRMYNKCGE